MSIPSLVMQRRTRFPSMVKLKRFFRTAILVSQNIKFWVDVFGEDCFAFHFGRFITEIFPMTKLFLFFNALHGQVNPIDEKCIASESLSDVCFLSARKQNSPCLKTTLSNLAFPQRGLVARGRLVAL